MKGKNIDVEPLLDQIADESVGGETDQASGDHAS